jgi:hypothetical protein
MYEWCNNPDTVWSVALYAVDQGELGTAREVLAFFEKPWHYQELYEQFQRMDKP